MGHKIKIVTITITHHYDNDESWSEVHVGMTKEQAEEKAVASLTKLLTDEFYGMDVSASTLPDLISAANDECCTSYWTKDTNVHEVDLTTMKPVEIYALHRATGDWLYETYGEDSYEVECEYEKLREEVS